MHFKLSKPGCPLRLTLTRATLTFLFRLALLEFYSLARDCSLPALDAALDATPPASAGPRSRLRSPCCHTFATPSPVPLAPTPPPSDLIASALCDASSRASRRALSSSSSIPCFCKYAPSPPPILFAAGGTADEDAPGAADEFPSLRRPPLLLPPRPQNAAATAAAAADAATDAGRRAVSPPLTLPPPPPLLPPSKRCFFAEGSSDDSVIFIADEVGGERPAPLLSASEGHLLSTAGRSITGAYGREWVRARRSVWSGSFTVTMHGTAMAATSVASGLGGIGTESRSRFCDSCGCCGCSCS